MFTFLGVILVLIAIATLIGKFMVRKDDLIAEKAGRFKGTHYQEGDVVVSKSPKWMISLTSIRATVLSFLIGIIMIMIPYLFFFAEPGYQYFLVFPSGKKDAVMNEGIKWRGFATITPWDKFVDVKVVDDDSEITDIDAIEGVMKPIPMRFIDQVTAHAKVSARFQLPSSPEQFISLAIEFKSLANLIQTTLIPTVKEVTSNTGYMFAAQDYISGEAQNFRTTFEEQLSYGSYRVNKIENLDTIFGEITNNNKQRLIKAIKTSYTVKKIKDENGNPIRIPNEITQNGITVSQVLVDDIILSTTFKTRLEAQRDESAKRQLEQQKIKTAKDAQARIIAEGERDKSQERVNKELEQIAVLIAKETLLKEEETNKQLAQIKLETQEIDAKTIRIKADAEAYKIRKNVQAGITPEIELKMKLDAQVQMVGELAKTKWPSTYFNVNGGSNSKGNGPLESIIMAAMSKQLATTK